MKTTNPARDYLQQAFFIHRRILTLERERQQIRADIYGVRSPSNMSADRVQSSITGDKLERLIAKVDEREREIVDELVRLETAKQTIRAQIGKVTGANDWETQMFRTILYHRHILFETWTEIFSFLHLERSRTFELYGQALKAFEEILHDHGTGQTNA